jgi:hypothetical protein
MNKFILAATTAIAALGLAPSAQATVVEGIQLASWDPFDHFEGEAATAGASLTDTFHFSLDVDSYFTTALLSSVSGPQGNIDFISVDLDGVFFASSIVNGAFSSTAEIIGVFLTAGNHTLNVNYSSTKPKVTYSGNISIAPVPEPASWAMMVAGVAVIGVAMRRRTQTTRIAFA